MTTVERVRKQCVIAGRNAAVNRKLPLNPRRRWLEGDGEATMSMVAGSQPPEGTARWTWELFGDPLVERKVVDAIATETVRRTEKTGMKPWLKRIWSLPPRPMRTLSMRWRMCLRVTNERLPPIRFGSVWMRPRSHKPKKPVCRSRLVRGKWRSKTLNMGATVPPIGLGCGRRWTVGDR